jgi:hypothetical protein
VVWSSNSGVENFSCLLVYDAVPIFKLTPDFEGNGKIYVRGMTLNDMVLLCPENSNLHFFLGV